MLENTEGANKNGQSRKTGNIGHTRRRKTKQKHNTICVGHHHTQANTNNVNKTYKPSYNNRRQRRTGHSLHAEIVTTSKHGTQTVKTHNRTTTTKTFFISN
jgi:hypothetical protein